MLLNQMRKFFKKEGGKLESNVTVDQQNIYLPQEESESTSKRTARLKLENKMSYSK